MLDYLLHSGMLARAHLVRDDLVLTLSRSRSRSWLVVCDERTGLFCKQAMDWDGARTLENEWIVLRALSDLVPAIAPSPRSYDPEAGVLVVDAVVRSRTLAEHFARTRRISLRLTGSARRALVQLHKLTPRRLDPDSAAQIATDAAWPLAMHHVDIDAFTTYSAATIQLLGILQGQPAVCNALDQAAARWEPRSLLHGDLKWDNIVVVPHGRGRATGRLTLIDWEFARFGPPEWDFASLVAEYFRWWAASVDSPSALAAGEAHVDCGFPLGAMQPSAATLLRDSPGEALDLGLVMQFSAARLLQRAVEEAQHLPRVTQHLLLQVQLACNVLLDPTAALELVGAAPRRAAA